MSGMAVNCQVTSRAAAPRTVALPASLITKRRSSVPLAVWLCAPAEGFGQPAALRPRRGELPLARMTSVLPAGTASGGCALHRLARPQALQDHRRLSGIGGRADPGVDAEIGRQHHALPIECGSEALSCVHRRLQRTSQPPAPPPGRARRRDRAARAAASVSRLERLGRAQGALDMGAPQRERIRSSVGTAISSAIAVAGRCGRPELRSSRRKPSIRLGTRSASTGANAAAASRKKMPSPMARPMGGSQSQRPSQETARNRPTTVAIEASAGHSRSQKIVQRARLSARAEQRQLGDPARDGSAGSLLGGPVGQTCLQPTESANLACHHSTPIERCQRAKGRHLPIKTTSGR